MTRRAGRPNQAARILTIAASWAVLGALPAPARASAEIDTLSLPTALETALLRNAEAEAARHGTRAAEARVGEARGGYLPRLSFSAAYTRYEEPNIVVPIHEAGVFPPLDKDIFGGAAQLEVPLFDGGRTAAGIRRARARADEAAALVNLTETELLIAVGRVYVRAGEQSDQMDLLRARLEVLRTRKQEIDRLLDEGRAAPSDVARLLSAIEETRSDSIAMESGAFELALQLGRLVGRVGPVHPAPSGVDRRPGGVDVPPSSPPGIRGPRVLRAEANLDGAEAARSLTKRLSWPTIDGFATYAVRSGDPPDPIGEWYMGIGLRVPLFDGGRRVAEVRAASEAEAAARERVRAEREYQEANLLLALNCWNISRERSERLRDSIRMKEAVVASTRRIYEEGRVSLSELLTEEAELLSLEMRERGAAHAARIAALDYEGVLGMSSPERIVELIGREP